MLFSRSPFDPFARAGATLAYSLKPLRTNVFREAVQLSLFHALLVSLHGHKVYCSSLNGNLNGAETEKKLMNGVVKRR